MPRPQLFFTLTQTRIPKVLVLIGHSEKQGLAVPVWSIGIKVLWLPSSEICHKIVTVSEPQFLLPSNDLRRSEKLRERCSQKSRRLRLVVIVESL